MTYEPDPLTIQVYEYIRDHRRQRGISPTLREIGAACAMAHTSVLRHLDRLEAIGWIERDYYRPRSLRLGSRAPDYAPPD